MRGDGDPDSAWIETYTGKRFHLLDPQQEEIDIRDIAHALSMLVRYTGHVSRFFSVAEHSWLAASLVEPKFAMDALLHDAEESYVNDLNRPLKHSTPIGSIFVPIADKIKRAIETKFDLNHHESNGICATCREPCRIKAVDTALLYREKEKLLPPMSWDGKWNEDSYTRISVPIIGYSPFWAEQRFLERFRELASNKLLESLQV